MKTGYVVADIMTTKPLTVAPTDSIRMSAELMKQHDVSSMLISEGKNVVGLVTGKDFVFKAIAGGFSLDDPITSIMTAELHSITPDTDIVDTLKKMNKFNIRHLPVMEGDHMVGYVTMTAILKIEPQLFELFAEKIELRGISPDSSMLEVLHSEFSGQCESCGNFSSRLTENEGRMVCPNCIIV